MLFKSTRPSRPDGTRRLPSSRTMLRIEPRPRRSTNEAPPLPLLTAEPIDGTDARQFAQNLFGDVRLLELDRVRRGHVDRGRLLEIGVADQGAGNDDVLALAGLFLGHTASGGAAPGAGRGGVSSAGALLRKGRSG